MSSGNGLFFLSNRKSQISTSGTWTGANDDVTGMVISRQSYQIDQDIQSQTCKRKESRNETRALLKAPRRRINRHHPHFTPSCLFCLLQLLVASVMLRTRASVQRGTKSYRFGYGWTGLPSRRTPGSTGLVWGSTSSYSLWRYMNLSRIVL